MVIPVRPPNRIIAECDGNNLCKICGSSLTRGIFRKLKGCIQPECINYYGNYLDSNLESKLRKIIVQGHYTQYKNLIQTIVKIHREEFREETIPTSKEFIQELVDKAFEKYMH